MCVREREMNRYGALLALESCCAVPCFSLRTHTCVHARAHRKLHCIAPACTYSPRETPHTLSKKKEKKKNHHTHLIEESVKLMHDTRTLWRLREQASVKIILIVIPTSQIHVHVLEALP